MLIRLALSLIAASMLSSMALAQDVTVTRTGTLSTTGVTAGSCGDSSHSCGLTIDAKGRITAQSNNPVTAAPGGTNCQYQINESGALGGVDITGGDGSINCTGFMSVTATGGLPFAATATSADAANLTGTLPDAQLPNIITAGGPLGSSTTVPQITFDAHGRITAINSVAIAASGTVTSIVCPQEVTITSTGTCTEAHPHYLTGSYWYPPAKMPLTGGGAAVAANTIKCAYGFIPQEITLGSIGAWVSTAAAGGHFEWALYSNGSSRPNALIASSASISAAATGAASINSWTGTPQVGPGANSDVWWCFNSDNSTAIFRSFSTASANPAPSLIGSTSMANVINTGAQIVGVSCAGANCAGGSSTYGTWPSTLNGSTWSDVITNTLPVPAFQVASVP